MRSRITAMWWAMLGVMVGTVGVLAAVWGDLRVSVGWELVVAAAALIVAGIGAFIAPYRRRGAAALMIVGIVGVVAAEWGALSRWTVDLLTTATGGTASYVWNGVTYTPDVWGVLFGSVSVLGFAGAVLFTIVGAMTEYAGERAASGARSLHGAAAR